jgi:transposase InsO family protein
VSCYQLIEAERTKFPVQFMCRMLGVSRSGYHDWSEGPRSRRSRENATLTCTTLVNAMAESLDSTLKAELVSRMEFPTRQATKTAIFEYLGTFYNTRRLHSFLSYRSPVHFEEDRMEEAGIA